MANFVYQDLKHSPFSISYKNYVFYFSSVFHKNKFEREKDNYIKNENLKMKNKYKIEIDLSEYFTLSFYKKCETRGFYVLKNNLEIEQKIKCYF